jgi:hypothetical protein
LLLACHFSDSNDESWRIVHAHQEIPALVSLPDDHPAVQVLCKLEPRSKCNFVHWSFVSRRQWNSEGAGQRHPSYRTNRCVQEYLQALGENQALDYNDCRCRLNQAFCFDPSALVSSRLNLSHRNTPMVAAATSSGTRRRRSRVQF